MIKRFRIIGLLILLLLAGRMAAQVTVLDSVCSGALRHYAVIGEAGSTYTWILTPPAGAPVTLPSDADTLEMTWTYPAGTYELECTQHALNGCDAEAVYGLVEIVEQPDVYAGPDALVCIGNYHKLVFATADYYSSLLWETTGDGTFDNNTWLNPTYYPGSNDILNGTVTLILTGFGLLEDGGCEPSASHVVLTIDDEIVPQFEPIGPLCINIIPPALPDTSLEGMTGNWDPPVIATGVLGTFPYTFYPDDPAQCGVDTTILITITDEIIPQFETIGPLCINSIPPALPDTSLEGITGTWDPPTISTGTEGVFTFIFNPDDPSQCGVQTSIDIAVVMEILPLFDPIGPYCENIIAPALPDTSLNNIAGTWAPPTIDTSVPGVFPYIFTPNPDQCGLVDTVMITINQQVTPDFDPIGILCQYSAAPILPGISINGIIGTWNPAWINTTDPGTFTFTFTPTDPDQCGIIYTMDVVVIPEISPEFEPIGPLCQFVDPPVLPDTCLQGVPGTWDPPVVSTDVTGTFYFIFNPDDAIPCVLPVTITIEVISDIIPEFDPIGPLCQNIEPPALPGISINDITGTWDPPVINTTIVGEFTYIFTPDDGQCAVEKEIEIEITGEIIPEFDPIGPLCQGSTPSALPGTSLNNITGSWVPPIPNTDEPGTFTFVFTPDNPEQCGVEATMDIIVVTEIIPEFAQIGPLCQGSTPSALPGTSLNNITGTWEPPIPNTDEPGTFTYIFTPDDLEQCGVADTMDITIVSNITPLFDPIGPLCLGITAPALPAESTNTPPITGTWEPPFIDTSEPGSATYTFKPDTGQCAEDYDMIIVVTDEIMPLFTQIDPLCQFITPPPLPSASNNAPPITGTWSPSSIDTSVPGITMFTFTPDDGQCAISTSMPIEVRENVMPLFDQIGPLSQNSIPPLLPASSNNTPAITGTWNPPFIDTSVPGTYNYIFTPDPGQCASMTDMNITVLFDYLQAITGSGEHCLGDAAIVPIVVDKFHGVATFQLKLSYNVDQLNCEGYNPDIHPAFADHLTGWIDQIAGVITLQWQDINPVTFTQPETVLELIFTPKEPGLGQLQWYTGATESFFQDLYGASIPAEFYTSDLMIYNPPSILLAASKTVCDGEKVTIIGIASSSQPPISYLWTYPNGDTSDIDPFFSSVSYADAGYYTLEATDAMGCTDLKTILLIVSDNPVADFHGSDTLTIPVDYILDAGSGPVSYLWNTGETSESIEIDSTGLYWVEMVTSAGCTGIDSVYVVVMEEEIPIECIFVPNAFTPNGDGLNDTFKAVTGCPLSFFRMEIYNRWGEMIYTAPDISLGWDGKKNGEPCMADAYVYKIAYRVEGTPETALDMVKVGMVVIIKN